MSELTAKREARKLLGLSDENFEHIRFKDQSKEALLTSIELLKISIESQEIAFKAKSENLMSEIKSAKQAKAIANKRADKAEAALKKVNKMLSSLNTLTADV
jgi:hypothetical protein